MEHNSMTKQRLRQNLLRHKALDSTEQQMLVRMIDFIRNHPNKCCDRSLQCGHFTASAWILDSDSRTKVLLTHHYKLKRWLQLGGHADGNADLLEVALREAGEESGLKSITVVSDTVFDVDIHIIPPYESEPEHFHYDVRFLFLADIKEQFIVSDESNSLAWLPLPTIEKLSPIDSMRRLIRKTRLRFTA
jgi:8-oxo-dGTP pyrophosphatase MutT (NUDIX family)